MPGMRLAEEADRADDAEDGDGNATNDTCPAADSRQQPSQDDQGKKDYGRRLGRPVAEEEVVRHTVRVSLPAEAIRHSLLNGKYRANHLQRHAHGDCNSKSGQTHQRQDSVH